MISTNEKISIFIGNSTKKAQALFSSSCDQRPNKSPTKEGHEQVGGYWAINLVGGGT